MFGFTMTDYDKKVYAEELQEFLPDTIAQQLEIGKLRQTAFSKYYLGRLAVQGTFPVDL